MRIWKIYPILMAVLVTAAVLSFLLLSPVQGRVSEEWQLDLLEQAETYYRSEGRQNAVAIALYENVLEIGDLHPAIEREIKFNIACMLLFQIPPGQDAVRDIPRALEYFLEIVEKYPPDTRDVIQSWRCVARCYQKLGMPEQAAEAHLALRRAAKDWPSENATGPTDGVQIYSRIALGWLVNRPACNGLEGIAHLQKLAMENPEDKELVSTVEALIPAMVEAHNLVVTIVQEDGKDAVPRLVDLVWSIEENRPRKSPIDMAPEEGLWPVMVTGEVKRAIENIEPGRALELIYAKRPPNFGMPPEKPW
jgi:tetratricopeptide (TPR) repeat protein